VGLLLDSGHAGTVTLWGHFVTPHPEVLTVPQKRWVHGAGIGGGTQVLRSELRTIRALGREHGKTTVFIQDAPPTVWRHPRVAGMVGMGVLSS